MDERIQNALTLFNQCAPDGAVQAHMARIVRVMQDHGESHNSIVLAILDALTTGMRYDNWVRYAEKVA